MQRRRTRYVISYIPTGTVEIRTGHILAPSESDVRLWVAKRGTLISIETQRSLKARTVKRHGLVLDRKALADACDLLGIRNRVEVRFHGAVGNTNGTHRYSFPRVRSAADVASLAPVHRIVIKSYLSPEQASSTLWHELTHAAQAERVSREDPSLWWAFIRKQRRIPYSHRPIENEARDMSATMGDCLLFGAAA